MVLVQDLSPASQVALDTSFSLLASESFPKMSLSVLSLMSHHYNQILWGRHALFRLISVFRLLSAN